MKRTFKFIYMLFKMKLARQMTYRLSFFGALFVDGSMFVLHLLMFNVIYAQVDNIGGFSQGQMTIFIGTFSLINALNMTIYFFGVLQLPSKIQSGDFDQYLTKPVSPLLRITFENIDIGSSPLILLSIGIILYGVAQLGVSVTGETFLLYSVFIILMTFLWYDLEVIIRTLPFFFISNGISQVEETMMFLCMRVPGVVFKGAYKVLFYLILPYALLATIPTQVLTNTAPPKLIIYSVLIVIAFTIFAQVFFKFGLKHYKSASS